MVVAARRDIWWVNPDPVVGRVQGGRRPALVVSTDLFNRGPRGLVIVLMLTRTRRGYPFHVELQPGDNGLSYVSFVMCEQIRSVSVSRLIGTGPIGSAPDQVLFEVEDHMRTLLELYS